MLGKSAIGSIQERQLGCTRKGSRRGIFTDHKFSPISYYKFRCTSGFRSVFFAPAWMYVKEGLMGVYFSVGTKV